MARRDTNDRSVAWITLTEVGESVLQIVAQKRVGRWLDSSSEGSCYVCRLRKTDRNTGTNRGSIFRFWATRGTLAGVIELRVTRSGSRGLPKTRSRLSQRPAATLVDCTYAAPVTR